jgi:choline dehydrogenase-like flavoprotein
VLGVWVKRAAMGAEGWGYDDVLPSFRKAEDNERGEHQFHGEVRCPSARVGR